jgi:hypothetical protein
MNTVPLDYLFLVLSRLLVLFLGLSIVVLSYVAYTRMKSRMMLFISVGFGLITLGTLVEGLLYELLRYSLEQVHVVELAISLAGLLTLLYALRIMKEKPITPEEGELPSST